MHSSKSATLAGWLEEAAATVRRLESEGEDLLGSDGGQGAYEAKMREKALFLAGLAEDGAHLADQDPDIFEHVKGFSKSAESSLGVGSVFFMSALLYPENHQPGEPNNLDRLARQAAEVENNR